MVRKHTKNCPVPLVPTTVDLQVILNEVLAKYKILRVPTKSIHLENGGTSPLTFPPVARLTVHSKCSSYIGLVSGVRRLFFSIWVFFHEHLWITGLPEKGGGHFFNSSLPLSPASLSSWAITAESTPPGTFGYHQPVNYTRSGLATIKFFLFQKRENYTTSLKTSKGYLKNLKISNVADLLFWKSVIFRKSNLPESN